MENFKNETEKALLNEGYEVKDIAFYNLRRSRTCEDDIVIKCKEPTTLEPFNFEYNEDYGSDEITGHIMLKDGTWFERDNYDGKGEWQHCHTPVWEE